MKRSAALVCSFVVMLLCIPAAWSQERQEKVDLETITRIRNEGFHHSQVMELASGLMDSIGERLTGSPNMKRANEWTRDKLSEMGSAMRIWRLGGRSAADGPTSTSTCA